MAISKNKYSTSTSGSPDDGRGAGFADPDEGRGQVAASEAAQPARTAARRGFQRLLTEPPRPRAIARRPGAPWLAVGWIEHTSQR